MAEEEALAVRWLVFRSTGRVWREPPWPGQRIASREGRQKLIALAHAHAVRCAVPSQAQSRSEKYGDLVCYPGPKNRCSLCAKLDTEAL